MSFPGAVLLALAAAGAAVWVGLGQSVGSGRVRALALSHRVPPLGPPTLTKPVAAGPPVLRLPAAVVAGAGVALMLGGAVGVAAGVMTGVSLARWLATLEPRSVRARRERLAADVAIAADLLAACLASGSTLDAAAAAVADAIGGPLGESLHTTVATLRLGGDPVTTWRTLEADSILAPLARTLARAAETGAPVGDAVARLADEQRRDRRWAAEVAARRVGVLTAGPVGLCFLPAFLLIGIVPVIAGVVSSVLGDLL